MKAAEHEHRNLDRPEMLSCELGIEAPSAMLPGLYVYL
jgi:hypothetical protein